MSQHRTSQQLASIGRDRNIGPETARDEGQEEEMHDQASHDSANGARISLEVNGKMRDEPASITVIRLVEELTGARLDASGQPREGGKLGLALAVNAAVVPRSQWARHVLHDGDKVEVIGAVQGG